MHVNKAQVLCMDIHNFFPSINIDQVFEVFHRIGYTSDVAQALAQLCTHNGILPQGAPSSPALANIIFSAIDFISAVASKLLDGLASLITSLIDSFTNLMNLGGEFGNFLAALWPFMPPEITAVLLLGFTLSVLLMVIGFFKK